MIGQHHIIASGPNAGSLAPCPAQVKCRNGGEHYDDSLLEGLELYTAHYFKKPTKIKDFTPALIQYILEGEGEAVIEYYKKLAAKEKAPTSETYTSFPSADETTTRGILYKEYQDALHNHLMEIGTNPGGEAFFDASIAAQHIVASRHNLNPDELADFIREEAYSQELSQYRQLWLNQDLQPTEFDTTQELWESTRGEQDVSCPVCEKQDDGTVMTRVNIRVEYLTPLLSCYDCFLVGKTIV